MLKFAKLQHTVASKLFYLAHNSSHLTCLRFTDINKYPERIAKNHLLRKETSTRNNIKLAHVLSVKYIGHLLSLTSLFPRNTKI